MLKFLFLSCVILAAQSTDAEGGWVGGYVLMSATRSNHTVGLKELGMLAANAATLPVNRIWLAFFSPTMVYEEGSHSLQYTGLNVSSAGDYGFAEVKKYIGQLQDGGVEVYLSMGGWNYNCFPYVYARYSVGGYGPNTPNYWKIIKYGGGSISGCKPENQFCYVCEPPSQGTSLADFSIFPEPSSTTFKQAAAYVTQHAKGSHPPKFEYNMIPGQPWEDTKTGITVTVPGSGRYHQMNRDPYQDIVYLAKDLNATGIDLDYEEFWHADYYKYQSGASSKGPWTLPQTVYKYAAIAKDIQLNIQAIQPSLKMSTAAGAVGAWSGKWWGGNLKGVWLQVFEWYPDVVNFMANSGGINVMSYDLSDDEQFHECPSTDICTLPKQVAFYLNTYKEANIPANVGYEVGTPAYPSPVHNPTHQLPLTDSALASITSQTQTKFKGGFMWSLFKPAADSMEATPTQVAQAVCKVVMPGSARCSGSIPSGAD